MYVMRSICSSEAIIRGHYTYLYAKQKQPSCKKVRGQSEAALQMVTSDQKL